MSAGASAPGGVELHVHLAALLRARKLPELVACWTGAADGQRTPAAARSAAIALAEMRQLDEAQRVIDHWLADATDVATRILCARVAFDLGHYRVAIDRLEPLVTSPAARPSWWIIYLRSALGCSDPERALRLHAAYAALTEQDTAVGRAHAELLAMAGRRGDAETAFRRLLAARPDDAALAAAAGEFFLREFPEKKDSALEQLHHLARDPVLAPETVRQLNMLPAFYRDDASALAWRSAWIAAVRALTVAARNSPLRGDERALCLTTTPFLLAYHDADITEAQSAWGDFVEAVAAPLRLPLVAGRARGIQRIGIVSNRLNESSAGRFFNAWIDELLAAGFDLRLYAIGPRDEVTAKLANRAPLQHLGVDEIHRWQTVRDTILRDEVDALVFPEPQGSPLLLLTAALRCAPVQCAGYGNPLTTGLPSMDYFLSPDAAEVSSPTSHYRERVVRLAGMGTRIAPPPDVNPRSLADFGLTEGPRYCLISQQLQKWSPTFVDAVITLLQRDSNTRIVRFPHGSAGVSSAAFDDMLAARCADAGLAMAERVLTLPWLSWADFLALHRHMQVSLDTWPFGGGSTTVDALSQSLPVVTRSGLFLRGRQSTGLLRLAGLDSLAVDTPAQFVERAIEVARSPHEFMAARQQTDTSVLHASGETVFASIAEFISSL